MPITVSPATPNGARDDAHGTIYVTTGGGGSDLHGFNTTSALIPVRESVYHYVRVDVTEAEITLTAIREDGTQLDLVTR